MTTLSLISQLDDAEQDFEFYPTTNEIIAAMVEDLEEARYSEFEGQRYRNTLPTNSLLDIGAGHGKVLRALQASKHGFGELYAIEKSPILRQQLGADIFIVGTELEQQSLLSKQVDVIFSNPPYSQFVEWAVKIVRESAAPLVYVVIPVRWQESQRIADAIAFRGAQTQVVGEYTFEHAEDRTARARVHLLRIVLSSEKDDAFERFFNEQFGGRRDKSAQKQEEQAEAKHDRFTSLVIGDSYAEAIVSLYNEEMARIQRNYELVYELDPGLMRELDITPSRIMHCLKERLAGLRQVYWKELFDRMSAICDRLTAKKRQHLLATLSRHVHVDFTVDNIYAVILWVIQNANQYLDVQLIETFEQMVEKANVRLYKSNQRAFTWDRWRYMEEKPTHFCLEYRLVLYSVGGIKTGYSFERGLDERACTFLGDLLTVARNLGFKCDTVDYRLGGARDEWKSNRLKPFYFTRPMRVRPELLFEVRAFKNGNLHVRLNQRFALALNVEYGRLKGWLKSSHEAVAELDDTEAAALFKTNFTLPITNPTLLLTAA